MNAIERIRAGIDRTRTVPADCTGDCGYGPCNCSGDFPFANPASQPAFDALAAVDALYQAAKGVDTDGTSQFDTRTSTLLELRAAVRRVDGEA